MINVVVILKENKISVLLRNKGNTIDKVEWAGDFSVSEKLLKEIDKVLAKNSLKPKDISNFSVESDMSDDLTAVKIVKTVAGAFKFHSDVN